MPPMTTVRAAEDAKAGGWTKALVISVVALCITTAAHAVTVVYRTGAVIAEISRNTEVNTQQDVRLNEVHELIKQQQRLADTILAGVVRDRASYERDLTDLRTRLHAMEQRR